MFEKREKRKIAKHIIIASELHGIAHSRYFIISFYGWLIK